MIFNGVVLFLCILLTECKSVPMEDSSALNIPVSGTVSVPEDHTEIPNEPIERYRRDVLEPWIIYDSAEREIFKRSADENDWFTNYKTDSKKIQQNFLRSRRSPETLNMNLNIENQAGDTRKKPHLKVRRSADTYTGGLVFDPYMGRL